MSRTNIMLCYPLEEKRLRKWGFPVLVQPKLDGVRCRAVPPTTSGCETGWTLYSSQAKEIVSCPHITNELNQLPNQLWKEFDGELYNHNLGFDAISGITSRTTNLHEDFRDAQFHIFDVADELKPQKDRISTYLKLKGLDPSFLKPVQTEVVNNLDEIMSWFNWFVEQSYEGVVVRHPMNLYKRRRSTEVMKFKPHQSDWFKISSFKQETDKNNNPKEQLGSFICEDLDGQTFSVGSGLTDAQRSYWWLNANSLIGRFLRVKYQARNPNSNIPRFPVFYEIDQASYENH